MIYDNGVKGTIGHDQGTADGFNALGGEHIACAVDDIVFDETHKVLSTPAYMVAQSITQAASGIEKLVKKLVAIA
jgi:enhancing lycopene biosynthesis protein 2